MAPGFLSKLVRPNGSHSRNSSTTSSPQSPKSPSRNPSISVSSTDSGKNSVDKQNGRRVPPVPPLTVGYESSDSGPNVTIIPPSPSISGSSIPISHPPSPAHSPRRLAPDENLEGARRRIQSLPAVPAPTSVPLPSSPRLSDDGLTTPTPTTTTFVNMPPVPSSKSNSTSSTLKQPLSSENMRHKSQGGSQRSTRSNNPRSATTTEDGRLQPAATKELRHQSSNRSIRSKLSIMLPSRDHTPQPSQQSVASSRHERSISAPYPPSPPSQSEEPTLVESPTGFTLSQDIPTIAFARSVNLPTSSTSTSSFGATLLVPDNSDAASVTSVGSAGKKRRAPWRRPSTASSAAPSSVAVSRTGTLGPTSSTGGNKPPSRKNTAVGGLASALASSGLAMANPGMSIPPIAPAPAETSQAAARGRTSYDGPAPPRSTRSRGASMSMNHAGDDHSDRDSFHSQDDSDSEGSDDSDELDLDPEDFPVTGFAVASNRRNQDFHELFPSVPEGDYLIEDYGCALQRDILIQGRLYISENHVCFHANIFGWITDLSIPMYEVISLEKRMTAFVIPNAVQLSTRTAKYTFTSFLSRDTTFDVLFNVWRLARPEDDSMGSRRVSPRGSLDNDGAESAVEAGAPNGTTAKKAVAKNKVTKCDCGTHYPEVALDAVFPGTPDKIYNLMFTSGFMKDFMRENQKLLDIQISDWTPTENPKLLARNMTYIKPLNGSIGPKQTRCELRDETIHCDFDNYVCMLTTTRTPEVPSGGVFSVKTKTCITWASSIASRVLVTTQVEWTGRSFIKGIIEKSCIDGQKTYHVDLDKAIREYIHEHQAEFIPDGIDVAVVEETAAQVTVEVPQTPTRAQSEVEVWKEREHERNQRSLQWAYDTLEGALKVGRQSTEGALELIRDAWDQSSSTTILYFLIVFLVLSNLWTLTLMGAREEAGRRKEMRKMEEREKWVQGIVTGFWEELLATRGAIAPPGGGGTVPSLAPRQVGCDAKEEVATLAGQLDLIEQRIRDIREGLKQVQIEELD